MSHKTLVNGTVYEVDGGKTLIDGVAYSIDKGKTLVGGTAYEVGFVEMVQVQIVMSTGTNHSGSVYATINGVTYCSEDFNYNTTGYPVFEVPIGTEILFTHDYGRNGDIYGASGYANNNLWSPSGYIYTVNSRTKISVSENRKSVGPGMEAYVPTLSWNENYEADFQNPYYIT